VIRGEAHRQEHLRPTDQIAPEFRNNRKIHRILSATNQDTDWFALDFGEQKKFERVILHIYDDRGGVQAPRHYRLERWKDDQWQEIPNQKKSPQKPVGSAANTVLFPPVESSKLRVVFSHLGKGHIRSGLTEIEVWSE
jgi:hypothetical protein